MMPAQAEIDGSDIYLVYPETHKFHFSQLKMRTAELEALTSEVLGEGYTVHLIAPGETIRKKG